MLELEPKAYVARLGNHTDCLHVRVNLGLDIENIRNSGPNLYCMVLNANGTDCFSLPLELLPVFLHHLFAFRRNFMSIVHCWFRLILA